MPEEYKIINTSDGRAWTLSSRLRELREVDAIVFDCDGVLVDTRRSYDAAIAEVVDRLLRWVGVRLPWKRFTPSLILRLRRTGGFNNDWDTVYALVLFSILALPASEVRKLTNDEGWPKASNKPKPPLSLVDLRTVTNRIVALTQNFCSKDGLIGYESVNRFVQANMFSPVYASALDRVQEWLGYPGSPPTSLLSTIFDELYHGSKLYRQLYGVQARYYPGKGLIEGERTLVRRRDLEATTQMSGRGRLAITTGRPYLPTKYVLGDLMAYFNRKASIFIGDMDVHPELASKLSQFRKPSGLSLVHARRALSSDMVLYAGDSAEDIMMAEEARRLKEPVLFAGIYGTGLDRNEQSRYFKEYGVDLILPTARQIPLILRTVKG